MSHLFLSHQAIASNASALNHPSSLALGSPLSHFAYASSTPPMRLPSSLIESPKNSLAVVSFIFNHPCTSVVDESSVLDRVTVRADERDIFERVVLAVSVFVVKSKNLWMLRISAPLALINSPSPLLECPPKAIWMNSKWLDQQSACSAAIASLVSLPFHDRKRRSALLTESGRTRLVFCQRRLSLALTGAVRFVRCSYEMSAADLTHPLLVASVEKVPSLRLAIAGLRTKLRRLPTSRCDSEFLFAYNAIERNATMELVFRALRSSHLSILTNIMSIINGGVCYGT